MEIYLLQLLFVQIKLKQRYREIYKIVVSIAVGAFQNLELLTITETTINTCARITTDIQQILKVSNIYMRLMGRIQCFQVL